MYKKCENCYKDGKTPNEESCKKCEDDLKAKEQECEKVKQNAQDTYDLWQALIDSFNILQGDKIKLEQECERLEEANNTLTVTREKLLGDLYIVEESLKDYTEHYNRQSEELDQLKAENEELKKWKKEHLKDVEFIERNPVIDILNSMADNILLEQRNEKLKQALTEIKEIAENVIKNVSDRCIETTPMYGVHKQILQKISKVIK